MEVPPLTRSVWRFKGIDWPFDALGRLVDQGQTLASRQGKALGLVPTGSSLGASTFLGQSINFFDSESAN